MNALLWALVISSAIDAIAVVIDRFRTPITTSDRVFDAIWTFCIGGWALWLLAKGGAT